jgi:hypothetical protein
MLTVDMIEVLLLLFILPFGSVQVEQNWCVCA